MKIMQKFPELKPLQLEYFRNVFRNSEIFKKKVKDIREKYRLIIDKKKKDSLYSDTFQFFRASIKLVDLQYTKEEKEKWLSFENDVKELADFFHLTGYIEYLRKYILYRWFEPLDLQNVLIINNDKITIELPFQVTKEEFNKIRRDIQSAQKSAFAKSLLVNWKIKEKFKRWDFDKKFYYYRNKFYWDPIPEKLLRNIIEESNKINRISEINKLIHSL